MASIPRSGQSPFAFVHRADLQTVPSGALNCEVNLHGGFATDPRPDAGQVFYGMPGCGLIRITPDLRRQEVISLPDELRPLNFHSTKIGAIDGQWRLFLPANDAAMVAVLDLDGRLDFALPRPEFEAYAAADIAFKPTDTLLVGRRLYVADGYGANYISIADAETRAWSALFGGKTTDPRENGGFATAHGISLSPDAQRLVIADRPHSRLQWHDLDGRFVASRPVPPGAWPCGIDFAGFEGKTYAVTGCLRDPVEGRPAPIYVLDGDTLEVLSTIRPKEDLAIDQAQHLHNVIWHQHDGRLFLVCQSWQPGHYFVLERT